MWLFLPFGFFSIVQKTPTDEMIKAFGRDYPKKDYLCVRGRQEADLEKLRNLLVAQEFKPGCNTAFNESIVSKIIEGYGTDYQVRMYVKRNVLSQFMATTVLEMDYRNFKNKASKEASYLHGKIFSKVWSVLWGLAKSEKNENQQGLWVDPFRARK